MPEHLPVIPVRRNVPEYAGRRYPGRRDGGTCGRRRPMPQLAYDPPVRTIHRITPEPQD
jgi:hypothetical protein